MAGLVVGLAVTILCLWGASGALAATPVFSPVPGSPFPSGAQPYAVAFSPSGGLLASVNVDGNTVSVFSVGSGGALTPVAGSPFPPVTSPRRWRSARTAGCSRLPNGDNTVSVFTVSSGGALTPVAGSPFPTGNLPASVTFSPDGGLLATPTATTPCRCSRSTPAAR